MDLIDPKPHAPRGRLKAIDPIQQTQPIQRAVKPAGKRGCTAHKRNGDLCGGPAIQGGTVCRMHGGGAPQVKQAAEERLRALVYPAITRLGELVDQKEFPSVAIAAVKDVLDRNLGKAVEQQTVEHTGGIEISWKISTTNSQNP